MHTYSNGISRYSTSSRGQRCGTLDTKAAGDRASVSSYSGSFRLILTMKGFVTFSVFHTLILNSSMLWPALNVCETSLMEPFEQASYLVQVRRLRELAGVALAHYPIKVQSCDFVNHGENTT